MLPGARALATLWGNSHHQILRRTNRETLSWKDSVAENLSSMGGRMENSQVKWEWDERMKRLHPVQGSWEILTQEELI